MTRIAPHNARQRGTFVLNRYTQIGELAASMKATFRKSLWLLFALGAAEMLYLVFEGRPGSAAFGMIAGSTFLILLVWSREGQGLPLLPLLALQNLVIYGMPIAFAHPSVAASSEAHVFQAGLEVLIFGIALTAAWKTGMQLFSQSRAFSYVLVDVDREGVKGLNRLGFALVGIATGYVVAQCAGIADILLDRLPAGSNSIFVALVSAASACGFFMVALSYGSGTMPAARKLAFWGLLALNSLVTASSFLLSSVVINLVATTIGLFWSSGKAPWRFLLCVSLILSFLNIGKFTMRDRYWSHDDDAPPPTMGLADIPGHYQEWFQASYDALSAPPAGSPGSTPETAKLHAENRQSLTDRIDNLQNLLFVIEAEDADHIEPVHGATYQMIPALLIPRIIWPDKPRTHEGQVFLNVHFGRQDLNSTFTTYVAWGILPEAYGNFGPVAGAVILGGAVGLFFAWVEKRTAQKLAISLEGIVGFGLILNMLNSFEMVSSVLVTSSFQNLVPIVFAFSPFIRRQKLERPDPA